MTDMPTIAPLGDLPEAEPTADSSLDELATYALLKQDRIIARDKMNGEDLWLMGQALQWAKDKLPYGEWEQWWKAKGFKKTYVWQARTLHDKAKLDGVKELGLTEALRKFAVVAEKKPQAGTKASGSKKNKTEINEAVPTSNEDTEKQTEQPDPSEEAQEQSEAGEPNNDEEGGDSPSADDQPADSLADEEATELKEFQQSLRKLTPKTRAVAIQHTLELLRDELDGEEVDEELQQTFGQIAHLAEELKGLTGHDEQDS